ncbi:hypothetical protein OG896_19615 [Streptomyces sp. NBC_00669]|uniref:hypothetical protein n=1 Tax=Streptomyces sp. NBC_00669 TaxID=2976011 RepID=UPI002E350E11|nr:hypothetical protein [Streptomyces sp. NBC_00669]
MLDAILDADAPTHSFATGWRAGVDLASMDNGAGDQYAIVFDPAGVFLYGFDHECDVTPWREEPRAHWPGLLDGLPASLAHYATTPEFQFDGFFDATVCVWREAGAPAWECGPVEFADHESDGAGWLFGLLTEGSPEAYVGYAQDYYGGPVDLDAVRAVLAGDPLTRRTVTALSATANFEALTPRAGALGYRVQEEPGRGLEDHGRGRSVRGPVGG